MYDIGDKYELQVRGMNAWPPPGYQTVLAPGAPSGKKHRLPGCKPEAWVMMRKMSGRLQAHQPHNTSEGYHRVTHNMACWAQWYDFRIVCQDSWAQFPVAQLLIPCGNEGSAHFVQFWLGCIRYARYVSVSTFCMGPHRLVVRTSRCGRDNPGSTPGVDIFADPYSCH